MKPEKLLSFVRDRSIHIFDARTIKDLWRAGLVRADAVTSSVRIEVPSLTFVSEENGTFLYCDTRSVPHRTEGYGGVFKKEKAEIGNLELYFHPFRLYVLHHVDRIFRAAVSSTQYLMNPEGLATLSKHHAEQLDRWTSGEQCAERVEYWNRVAELAIIVEPTAYFRVFHLNRWTVPNTEEAFAAKLGKRREQVNALLSGISREEIDNFREDLCWSAENCDHNKMIHVLLRLMSANERLKLRSSLGAAMLLLSMAEMIRRAAEEAKGENFFSTVSRQAAVGEFTMTAQSEARTDFTL